MGELRVAAEESLAVVFGDGDEASFRLWLPQEQRLADPVTVHVIPTTTDRIVDAFGASAQSDEHLFEVLVADVPAPAARSEIEHMGRTYRVSSARRKDRFGLVWLVGCKEAKGPLP